MKNCECDNCVYCKGHWHNTRKSFMCCHYNQEYIIDYFKEHKIQKMPGFIGFGDNYATKPKNKTTPKWCPNR